MAKTIVIAGYGPGISHAVAEKFGAAGFSLALVARNEGHLAEGVNQLKAKGFNAAAFRTDVGNTSAVRKMVKDVRTALGPISVVHWNAAAPMAGDLLTAPIEDLLTVFNVGVAGLVTAVQEALPDLRQTPGSAVLVTNGGFGLFADATDAYAVQSQSMGLSVGNAAKHKAVRVLAKRLEPEGIFVGEVMVLSMVKGTAWDRSGSATLKASTVADRFWQIYQGRSEHMVQVSG